MLTAPRSKRGGRSAPALNLALRPVATRRWWRRFRMTGQRLAIALMLAAWLLAGLLLAYSVAGVGR